MKNVKLNLDRIKKSILDSKDFTELAVKKAIKELSWHKHLSTADSEAEAEELFKKMFADSGGGAEEYMRGFGGFHSKCTETFDFDITDPSDEYTHQFRVRIYEYYVDSGSVDYIYGVSVSQL